MDVFEEAFDIDAVVVVDSSVAGNYNDLELAEDNTGYATDGEVVKVEMMVLMMVTVKKVMGKGKERSWETKSSMLSTAQQVGEEHKWLARVTVMEKTVLVMAIVSDRLTRERGKVESMEWGLNSLKTQVLEVEATVKGSLGLRRYGTAMKEVTPGVDRRRWVLTRTNFLFLLATLVFDPPPTRRE